MRSFYHYMMAYRGVQDVLDPKKQLADWMFKDHDFPKHSTNYEEISDYLEFHSPFNNALSTFDEAWTEYIQNS
ncbi:YozE family protein [Aquisalibacillus elongatus]|uniref:YozE family protein n=1 Tax=Aquisalibacillus elongatus TaxID=485577 RepID=UPI000F51D4A5|nr:YozE family protein [Aquisalibacillus elongatus]